MNQRQKPTWPPTPKEIARAVENAGYPLELRIYESLKSAGFDPTMPFRSRIDGEPRTKEIDLLASLSHTVPFEEAGEQCAATFALRLFIQAKRLHDGLVIGLRGPDRAPHELRAQRAIMGGLPSWGIGGSDIAQNLLLEEGGLASAFDLINSATQCVHWATVKLSNKGGDHFRADHDLGLADDIETLVCATDWHARDWSQYLLDSVAGNKTVFTVNVHFNMPLVVVEKDVRVYHALSSTVIEAGWFTLHAGVDVDGRVLHRPVDVISESSLPTMIGHYKNVFYAMRSTWEARVHEFAFAAVGLKVARQSKLKRT